MKTQKKMKRGAAWAMACAAGASGFAGVAWAQPDLMPGNIVVIGDTGLASSKRIYVYDPGLGGPAQEIGGGQPLTDPLDLAPVIGVNWYHDRADIVVGGNGTMLAFTQFGLGGSEPMGIWGTGGVAVVGVSGYDDPVFNYDDPEFGFGLPIAQRVAFYETGWASFDEPALGMLGGTGGFARVGLYATEDGLYVFDVFVDTEPPLLIPGTDGLGTVLAATAFAPGSVATQPRPDIPGAEAAIAFLVGGGGADVTLYGIWGTNGTAYDGVDGEAIWGTDGIAIWGNGGTAVQALSSGGFLTNPTSLLAFPMVDWLPVSCSFLVADAGGLGSSRGLAPARIIGILGDGTQSVITEGNLLVNPQDIALEQNGTILVADPDAAGGDGAIIRVELVSGEQTVVVAGGESAGFVHPVAVGVLGCALPTYVVNSSADFVDPVPGDGDPSNGLGQVCLRSAVMEANASACGGAIIELPSGTFPLWIPGLVEDGSATGDVDITADVRIRGVGSNLTVIDGNNVDRVLHVLPGGTLTLSALAVEGGNVPGDGGGVFAEGDLAMTGVVVRQCTAVGGGGVTSLANAVIIASTIRANIASGNGGGLASVGTGATLTVVRSLIGFNSSGLNGGGLNCQLCLSADLINTTITGNECDSSGGGVHVNQAPTSFDHCTIVNNQADLDEAGWLGGGIFENGGSVFLANTILARNDTPLVFPQNGAGGFVSQGYNLLDDTTGFVLAGDTATNVIADPQIGGIADNGGATQTHAIGPGSPALDAADPADTTIEDQRDFTRPEDGDGDTVARTDIGAYEFAPPTCGGDIDGDGDTDVFDFGIFATNFGQSVPAGTLGDLDGDGDVDVFDFGIFATDFGCPG